MGKFDSLHVRVPQAFFEMHILIVRVPLQGLQIFLEFLKCKLYDVIYISDTSLTFLQPSEFRC